MSTRLKSPDRAFVCKGRHPSFSEFAGYPFACIKYGREGNKRDVVSLYKKAINPLPSEPL